MKTYGYARVSSPSQRWDRQIVNITKAYPDAILVKEKYTGAKIDRPEWNKLYKLVKSEAAAGVPLRLVFDEASRLARNAEAASEIYETLFNLGVELVFLKTPGINSSTYKAALDSQVEMAAIEDQETNELVQSITAAINKYILALARKQIFLAFKEAEDELNYLHQRTSEGIKAAAAAGKRVGASKGDTWKTKKSIAAKKAIREKAIEFGGTYTNKDLIAILGCSPNSYYRWKKELIAEINQEEKEND